jgi:hypothetical protein
VSEESLLENGLVLSVYFVGGAPRAMLVRIRQEPPAPFVAFGKSHLLRLWFERQEMSLSKNVVKGGATRFFTQVIENAAKINMQTMSLLPMRYAIM